MVKFTMCQNVNCSSNGIFQKKKDIKEWRKEGKKKRSKKYMYYLHRQQ